MGGIGVTLPAAGGVPEERGRGKSVKSFPQGEDLGEGHSPENAIAELSMLLQSAVCRRIGDDDEVAVFLSGGLDSSLIAALLREMGVRLHLFTLDFGAPFDIELPYAQSVAKHIGLPLHIVDARPKQIRKHLEATAAALYLPFGDAVTVPLYLLGKAAAGYARRVFNGEGGDQLFGGWANKPMIAASLYGEENKLDAYMATFHRFYGATDRLYTPAARALTQSLDARDWVGPALAFTERLGFLHGLRAANLALKGRQNIAPRAVQLAAVHGLAAQSPFFDTALTDWTFTLPPESFLQGACEKWILKRVAERYLPEEIVWREKRGMGVPVTEWCTGALRWEIRRRLSSRRLARDGWFNPAAVRELAAGRDSPGEFRRRRRGEKLWALLMLHAWLDTRPARPRWSTEDARLPKT